MSSTREAISCAAYRAAIFTTMAVYRRGSSKNDYGMFLLHSIPLHDHNAIFFFISIDALCLACICSPLCQHDIAAPFTPPARSTTAPRPAAAFP